MSAAETAVNNESVFNIQVEDALTMNVEPLLHEIQHALDRLIQQGSTHIIDLRSIPLAPGEEQTLLDTLGVGEVQAIVAALGPSEIKETRYTGVWLITHYNDDHEILSRHIEITPVPTILSSPVEDMQLASQQLQSDIGQLKQTPRSS